MSFYKKKKIFDTVFMKAVVPQRVQYKVLPPAGRFSLPQRCAESSISERIPLERPDL